MDITQVILIQHAEQRQGFAYLDDIDRHDAARLGPVWERLAILLEAHAAAEERYFYPRLLEIGTGGGEQESAASETKDAIKDHNEIRDAVRDAGEQDVGSDEWWDAVVEARKANSDHMAEEEREDLADFRRHADLATRHAIALDFLAFEAEHATGIRTRDRDPDAYVAGHDA